MPAKYNGFELCKEFLIFQDSSFLNNIASSSLIKVGTQKRFVLFSQTIEKTLQDGINFLLIQNKLKQKHTVSAIHKT